MADLRGCRVARMSVVAFKRTGLVASVKTPWIAQGWRRRSFRPAGHRRGRNAACGLASPAAMRPHLTDSNATTAVHISKDQLHLLRLVAVTRANQDGGRPSVSNVLLELIEANRPELERGTVR